MALQQPEFLGQLERVQIELEANEFGKRVRIRLEKHDERLGWYPASSFTLPMHQLPLLEQALASMRASDTAEVNESEKIIPFPGIQVCRADD